MVAKVTIKVLFHEAFVLVSLILFSGCHSDRNSNRKAVSNIFDFHEIVNILKEVKDNTDLEFEYNRAIKKFITYNIPKYNFLTI